MPGSLKIAVLDLLDFFHKQYKELCFDSERCSRGFVEGAEGGQLRSLFDRFLLSVSSSEKICISPMMGNDDAIDVLKLYVAVREKGGFEEVSRNELWDAVAEASGLKPCSGSTVKFIYTKYLDSLDAWLQKIGKEIKIVVAARAGDTPASLVDAELECGETNDLLSKKKDGGEQEASGLNSENVQNANDGSDVLTDECADNVGFVPDTSEDVSGKMKKDLDNERRILQWVLQAAKDPCNPEIGCLPDWTKWKNADKRHTWKQFLLAREAMMVKRPIHTGEEQSSASLLRQKMHPFMYDDFGQHESLRCSPRIQSAKIASQERKLSRFRLPESGLNSESRDPDNQPDKESDNGVGGRGRRSPESALFSDTKKRKRVAVGSSSQVELPECVGREAYVSDPKWTSVQTWPLKNNDQNKYLIERDRIGKGRQDSCGCQLPGSIDCVRFHVNEKKARLKLELSSAYEEWGFHKMGENIALLWEKEDEVKFDAVVQANTPSQEKSFWIEIFKAFPKKSREELVSYYYNVFILQRRSQQNRSASCEIDSDDDESRGPYNCFGQRTASPPGSIFSSPKKPNSRNNNPR